MAPSWKTDDVWDPSNPENKQRTRALQTRVRQLLNEWDPIGIAGATDDEYDSLISPILHRLHDRQSTDQLVAWLVGDVAEYFGLTFTGRTELVFVQRLQEMWTGMTGVAPNGA